MGEEGLLTDDEKVSLVTRGLRLPPSKPLESECCGNGCTPCIFDWYEQKLVTWAKSTAAQWPEGREIIVRVLKTSGLGEEALR